MINESSLETIIEYGVLFQYNGEMRFTAWGSGPATLESLRNYVGGTTEKLSIQQRTITHTVSAWQPVGTI